MPAPVSNVAWKCSRCGKRKWLKPGLAKRRQFCSRDCLYASRRDALSATRLARSERQRERRAAAKAATLPLACPRCDKEFRPSAPAQRFCSPECSLANARRVRQSRRSPDAPEPRPCEQCGQEFTPRRGSAGRFCSRPCTYKGQTGEKAANWKGGRITNGEGYVMVYAPGHRMAHVKGYVLEHRLVMEQQLGRYLLPGENVHHINGDKSDNRPENLELWERPQPNGVRTKDAPHCPTCTCGH